MTGFIELKNNIASLIDKSGEAVGKLGYSNSAESIKEIKNALDKKELMIVTIGEARRGKSSLLNALLNEVQPLFPVDVNVCTNVVTIVRYGETESVEVYIADSSNENSIRKETIERNCIGEYVSEKGNPNNYKNVKSLNIMLPNELLKEGVVFVDTPGVGSLNIDHAETTYSFIPNADMVLFVSDANSGYTESELDFLKRSYSYCKNIIFPVTKKDTNMDYQIIVDDNIEKISNTLNLSPDAIQMIPVSSTAKIRFLNNGNKSMYVNSNYEKLENTIWSTIAKTKADILLRPFIQDVRQELEKVYNSIIVQSEMLSADEEKLTQLIKAYDDESSKLKKFQAEGADWKNDLNYYFQGLLSKKNMNVQEINTAALNKLEQTIQVMDTKICDEKNYTKLLIEINDIISQGALNFREMIDSGISEKISEIRETLSLDMDINKNIFERIKFEGANEIVIEYKKQKVSDKFIGKGRSITMNTMGASAIGGVAGALIGGVIGTFMGAPVSGIQLGVAAGQSVGALFGGAKGCVELLSKYSALDVNTVKREISQYIASSVKNVGFIIDDVCLELKKQTLGILDKDLKNRLSEISENMVRIRDSAGTVKSDIPKKQAMFEQQKDMLQKLEEKWEILDKTIIAECCKSIPENDCSKTDEISENNEKISYEFL